jgi:hypothetical protein
MREVMCLLMEIMLINDFVKIFSLHKTVSEQ